MMKTVVTFLMMVVALGMSVEPVFSLSYEIDYGQDGTFETGGNVNLSGRTGVNIDIAVKDYDCATTGCPSCGPDDSLFGIQTYFVVDESQVRVTGCNPNRAGGCDPSLSGCIPQQAGVYNLTCSNFNYITVTGGTQVLGTITVDCIGSGTSQLRVADDIGGGYNDGFLSDCTLTSRNPAPGSVTIVQSGQNITTTTTSGTPSSTTTTAQPTTITTSASASTTSSMPNRPCVFNSLYGKGSEKTNQIRRFRNEVLAGTPEGRGIIALYDRFSPAVVARMERDPGLAGDIRGILDRFFNLMSANTR